MDFNQKDIESANNLMQKIMVKEIMTSPVVKIREDEDLSLAQVKFVNHHITHLPVIDQNDQVVGLLSRKYLYKAQSPRKIISEEQTEYSPDIILDGDSYYIKETLDSYILRHVMMKNPPVLLENTPVAEAIIQMARQNIGCICIVKENKKLKGIVTDREIVLFLGKIIGKNR